MTTKSIIASLLLACCLLIAVTGLSTPQNTQQAHPPQPMSRLAFLKTSIATTTLVLANSSPSLAKDSEAALKGTKNDPKFQTCLSQCVYDCTKPKGDEQKSRAECLPECKKQCASTSEQLLLGSPMKKD
eukprot:CAMPEP_0197253786 /NCGR_PEP_ID=MMETSP1429-20130617/66307_1 /TAXON_ID=49237 /ORGANISM="Chaetoceros  sp., Strain UNC1202" /LENGTH=128 /DNA_ID=CAMNT_0042716579 /DNA_START=29 /DNA_END=415 /DNA_ORIENTATION=-